MWPLSTDDSRNRLMIIFTDGRHSPRQNPCSLSDNFADMNVDILTVGVDIEEIDNPNTFPGCMEG